MNTRQALEASLAVEDGLSMAQIAAKTREALERSTLERKVIRYSKDAAMFAERGQMRDARRALYKAALAFEEWEAMP